MSTLELPAGLSGPDLNISVCPVGTGDDFPIQPTPGMVVVKLFLPEMLQKKKHGLLIPQRSRDDELDRATNQIKSPLRGEVIAIGRGEDTDPYDKRRKPLEVWDGDTRYGIGDIVHFRPIGSYLLDTVSGDDVYLLIGDREVLAVEKKR